MQPPQIPGNWPCQKRRQTAINDVNQKAFDWPEDCIRCKYKFILGKTDAETPHVGHAKGCPKKPPPKDSLENLEKKRIEALNKPLSGKEILTTARKFSKQHFQDFFAPRFRHMRRVMAEAAGGEEASNSDSSSSAATAAAELAKKPPVKKPPNGKPPKYHRPDFDWHGTIEAAFLADGFAEKCVKDKVNCPLPIAAIASVVSTSIFPKRFDVKPDGTMTPKALDNLEYYRRYFSPSTLSMTIPPAPRDGEAINK